jgi:hypothetical protein
MDIHQAEIKILSAGGLMTVDGDQELVRIERRPAPGVLRSDFARGMTWLLSQ